MRTTELIQDGRIAPVEFSLVPGTYSSPQTVEIRSAHPGASVYFTTDGSEPTLSSRAYSGPISVTASVTLKAVAVTEDGAESEVASSAYGLEGNEESFSGLPTPQTNPQNQERLRPSTFTVLPWAGFKSAVTYSFDDGWGSQIADYPQLRATGTRMTFYLICGGDLDPKTWAQAVSDGNELGNHTVHHCHSDGSCLSGTWSGSVDAEYDECTDYLKKKYGLAGIWTTAAPFGDKGYEPASKARFFLNRGTIPGQIGPHDNSDPHYLKAYVANAGDTADTFNRLIDLAHDRGRWQILVFHSLDQGYDWVKVGDLIKSIDHAKSKRDIWIDSMINVGAYWMGQRAINEAIRTETEDGTVLNWKLPSHFPTGKFVRVSVHGRTLKQGGRILHRDKAGYFEVALDPGTLTISP